MALGFIVTDKLEKQEALRSVNYKSIRSGSMIFSFSHKWLENGKA